MKKFFYIGLASLSLMTLAGCESIDRAIKGDDYVASSQAASQSQAASEAYKEEVKAALEADASQFPQLSTSVAEDEAQVVMHTTKGDITIKLFPELAPLAVENFLTHAKEGYYDNVTFHRVISEFMIQSGDPNGDGTGGNSIWYEKDSSIDSGLGFKNEISPYLYNIRGSLAMANAGADTNGSQFYINQNTSDQSASLSKDTTPQSIIDAYKNGGNPSLDGGYTVFGQVIDGMDVVDSIASEEVDSSDKPLTTICITGIDIVKDYDFSDK